MSGTGSPTATAALALADGTVFHGRGLGAQGEAVGEICFNTAMSGYQEILTDPSYAGQIITFTFPHIGNVGTNEVDLEAGTPAALGLVLRADVTEPSNWRAVQHLERWLEQRGLIGIAGVDTAAPDPPAAHRRRAGRCARAHVRAGGDRRGPAHRQGPRLAGAGGHGPRQGGELPPGLRLD